MDQTKEINEVLKLKKTLLDIAFRSSDYFASLVIIGLASILLSHIFIKD